MGSTLHYESENGAERFSRVRSHSEDCGQHSCGWTQRVSWCRWHTAWLQAVVPSQTATCRCVEIARVTIPADCLSHSALQTSRTTARPSCPPAQASHLPANQQTSFIPLAGSTAEYCHEHVCLSLCLHISGIGWPCPVDNNRFCATWVSDSRHIYKQQLHVVFYEPRVTEDKSFHIQ